MKIKKNIPLIDQHDKNGFWGGKFGGNFIPETLKKPVEDLTILFDSQGYEKSQSFDHKLLNKVPNNISKMLAGNIKIEDDFSKLKNYCSYIDISGALESAPGVKDIKKIDLLLNKVHNANK